VISGASHTGFQFIIFPLFAVLAGGLALLLRDLVDALDRQFRPPTLSLVRHRIVSPTRSRYINLQSRGVISARKNEARADTRYDVSYSLPVDPTVDDPSTAELLQSLPSDAAFRRVLAAIDLDPAMADDVDREHVVADLSEVDRRRAAAQVRFAAPRTLHCFEVPALRGTGVDDLRARVDPDAFGPQLRAVEEAHNRVYAVCSVPEGGAQSQLTVTEQARETTVAAFDPGSPMLSIRAENAELAEATLGALLTDSEPDDAMPLAFSDDAVRERFENTLVHSYTSLTLVPTADGSETEDIVLNTRASDETMPDFRDDDFTEELLGIPGLERAQARLLLDPSVAISSLQDESIIRIEVGFREGTISFKRFLPEATIIKLERAVAGLY